MSFIQFHDGFGRGFALYHHLAPQFRLKQNPTSGSQHLHPQVHWEHYLCASLVSYHYASHQFWSQYST